MLELINVSKQIGEQSILNQVSLKVEKGELLSILGPSGSGKSTLLNVIGLLTDHQGGSIRFQQYEYAQWSEQEKAEFRNRKLGFVFQFHHLLAEFNVEENILMPLFIRQQALGEDDKAHLANLCHHLGIATLLKRFPSELSGGEQQRVAVARALITKPDLLLADEPTGNLDNTNAENLYELFLTLRREWNQTILMVTHNEHLTHSSDRVIHINSGRIIGNSDKMS